MSSWSFILGGVAGAGVLAFVLLASPTISGWFYDESLKYLKERVIRTQTEHDAAVEQLEIHKKKR